MGEFWGADTEELQELYRTFERGSDTMEDEFRRLGNSMWGFNRPEWEGPDADAFFAEWERVANQAYELYNRIEEMGRQLREEAQEQDDASEPEDGLLDTLKGLAEQIYAGFNILKDTAELLWKGVREGRIDWDALGDGVRRLEDWFKNADFGRRLSDLLDSKAFRRIGRLVPVLDIYLAYEAFKEADDPLEYISAAMGVIGMIPHPITMGIGIVGDVIGIADWASEEFFDYDLSREVSDWFADTVNDGFDQKRWNPLLA